MNQTLPNERRKKKGGGEEERMIHLRESSRNPRELGLGRGSKLTHQKYLQEEINIDSLSIKVRGGKQKKKKKKKKRPTFTIDEDTISTLK